MEHQQKRGEGGTDMTGAWSSLLGQEATTSLTNEQIFLALAGTGAVAGIVTGLFNLLVTRISNRFRKDERLADERHAAKMRRDAAHDAAKEKFLPLAEDILRYIQHMAADAHWTEVGDFFPLPSDGPVLPSPEAVVGRVNSIRYGHPAKAVRDKAGSLASAMSGRFTEIVGNAIPPPTVEEWLQWYQDAEDLIERMHSREG